MKLVKQLIAAAALSSGSAATLAGPITVDAGWYGFCFDDVPSGTYEGCPNEGVGTTGNPFTFTLAGTGLLKVTDAFRAGDVLDVWVNSAFAFTTSAAVPDGVSQENNPDLAFGNPGFSFGSLLLGAGSYTVEIFVNTTPFGQGAGYIEVESVAVDVPEPATLGLLGLGLMGLGLRRKRAATA